MVSKKVIPAKLSCPALGRGTHKGMKIVILSLVVSRVFSKEAGIQFFSQEVLDAPVSSTGQAPQVRDDKTVFRTVNDQPSARRGHEARMIVPFPSVDSIANEPPESSIRSLMLVSPNPLLPRSGELSFSGLKP
jgi:hypothetical protein